MRTLILFAHYDRQHIVDPYVIHYLKALRELDDTTIVFVSDTDWLASEPIASLCDIIHTERTPSRDFGSWRIGWIIAKDHGLLDWAERVVFVNDSAYAPLFPLSEMWDTFHDADMYGACESEEQAPHFHSFFLAFDLHPHVRAFLDRFWDEFEHTTDLGLLIYRYEVGLSVRAREAGLVLKPYISSEAFKAKYAELHGHPWVVDFPGDQHNGTHFWWDGLIRYHRFPFLKIKTARARPVGQRVLLDQFTDYPYGLIEGHVDRLNRPDPPDLDTLALKYGTDKASDGHDYCRRVYEQLFAGLRDEPITLLELGVDKGASIKMWREFFPHATIIGVDNFLETTPEGHRKPPPLAGHPVLAELSTLPGVHVLVCEHDAPLLPRMLDEFFPLDVVIDDGSHKPGLVQASFGLLWSLLRPGGLYIIEDVAESFLRPPELCPDPTSMNGCLHEFVYELPGVVVERSGHPDADYRIAVARKP